MKTPRQILFERHRAAAEKLDQIRAQVVASQLRPAIRQPADRKVHWIVLLPRNFWLELIWRPRRVWAGFAAVWLAVVVVNLADSDRSATAAAGARRPPAGFFIGWEQQEKMMAELTGQTEKPEADRPKPAPPRPRSERLLTWALG